MSILIGVSGYGYLVNEAELVDAMVDHTTVTREHANRFIWGRQQGNPLTKEETEQVEAAIVSGSAHRKLTESLSPLRQAERMELGVI